MAKPRVFISSTFYDLKQVREDLERFIKEIGYEPVRNETGAIPYGIEKPETYAYREVQLSDVIVAIIGGRFGSESTDNNTHSISMQELKSAYDHDIQVFIFIERSVNSEFSTYLLNKDNPNVNYQFVDDIRVYEFIEEVHALPKNNPIATFEQSSDIVEYLRSQWAGMFQRFLSEEKRKAEYVVLQEMKSVSRTLRELVTFLTQERENKDEAIKSILLANHPAFREFAALTNTPYRVFFTNKGELNTWLRNRTWTEIPNAIWDQDSFGEWEKSEVGIIKLNHDIFDSDGKLKVYNENEWESDWLEFIPAPKQRVPDDDIPF